MNIYDDMGALSDYFAEFSTVGALPPSYRGLGSLDASDQGSLKDKSAQFEQELVAQSNIEKRKQRTAADLAREARFKPSSFLGGPDGGPEVLSSSGQWVPAERVQVRSVRNALQLLGYPIASGIKYGADLAATWAQYTKLFSEKRAGFGQEPGNPGWVFMQPGAPSTLAAKTKAAAAGGKKAPTGTKISAPTTSPNVLVSTDALQKIMTSQGVDPKNITDGKLGPTTKGKWQAATKARGLSTTITGRTGALKATVNRAALAAMRAAVKPAEAPVAKADTVVSTEGAQTVLLGLGFRAPGNNLTDGLYGPTTAGFWAQAANKRNLDPFIAKKSADGRSVTVRERTYLMLKADADAKAPPAPGDSVAGPVFTNPAVGEVEDVLGRIVRAPVAPPLAPSVLLGIWTKLAEGGGLPADIQLAPDQKTFKVQIKTWEQLKKAADAVPPRPAPAPGPQRSQLELDVARILEGSKTVVTMATVRGAINAAVQEKRLARTPVTPGGPWENAFQSDVIAMLGVDQAGTAVWQQALLPGKLVKADGSSLRLPKPAADSLKRAAASLKAAVKEAKEIFNGYTEVNAPSVISRINGLSVTSEKFDPSGDAKVLADAIKTFLEETKAKIPAGALVRLNSAKTKTYVKDSVMASLAAAVTAAQGRANATKRFRDQMVARALGEATAVVPITRLQTAFEETVFAGTAGVAKKLFSAVKVTGSFDAPTRAAYTELARTRTIGPAIQEYQSLLGSQKKFTSAQINTLVTEARNQVWGSFLDQAVTKAPLSIKTLPAIAQQVDTAAKDVEGRMSVEDARKKEAQATLAAQNAALASAIKKSTAIVSILDLQMALLQMLVKKEIDPVAGLKPTGRADAATKRGFFELSGLIFPQGVDVSEILWSRYLDTVGIIVVSAQQVKKGWPTANYTALPVGVADLVAKNGGLWVEANGLPPAAGDLFPLPLKNEQLRLRFKTPSVISVKRPPPKEVAITDEEAQKDVIESKKPAAMAADAEQIAAAEAESKRKAQEAAAAQARRDAEQRAARDKAVADQATAAAAAAREREARAAAQAAEEARRRAAAAQAEAQRTQNASAAAAAAAAAQEAQRRIDEAEQRAAAAEAAAAAARAQAATPPAVATTASTTAGGAQVTGPSITGPTIQITTPAAPAPAPAQQAGMFGGGLAGTFMLLAGVGAIAYTVAQKQGEERT